jgi:hypothetical protein
MTDPYPAETGCCPRFVPEPFDEQELHWQGKRFLEDRVRCLFYVPWRFGAAMKRNLEKIDKADARTPDPPLILSESTSPWSMNLFLEVGKEVPGLATVNLDGNYLSKVFEGPYREAGQWHREMESWVESRGRKIARTFMYYTTCPRCAKHYGENYVVILAAVS